MSNSKDKRINKLKKKRIWPSVLGLFVIAFIFGIILFASVGVNIIEVVQRKLLEGLSQTETIAVLFEDYEGKSKQEIKDIVSTYVEMTPEIEAVWVSDLDGDKVWATNDMTPDVNKVAEIFFDEEETIS